MNKFWMVVFLTLIWCGFSGNFGWLNILLGALVASVCYWVIPADHYAPYTIRVLPLLRLLLTVLIELIKSSLIVAWEVITPGDRAQPSIIEVPLSCEHEIERTVLANLISLTPGTLSIDLSPDKSLLTVHVMFAQDPTPTLNFIHGHLEPQVIKVFRRAHH